MQLFYNQQITQKGIYNLDEQESLHAIKVLRLKVGDTIDITNGNGFFFKAKIIDTNIKSTCIEVYEIEQEPIKRNYNLHIAIAPTKNSERFEWFVEKAVEIGIDHITPIICQHSERKSLNIDRTEKIIISAMKQSLKAHKTQIYEPIKFEQFVKNNHQTKNKYLAHIETNLTFKNIPKNDDYLFLIGPEGGFSNQEIVLAQNNGFQTIKISEFRLRTETAGIFVANALNVLLMN